MIIWNVYPIHKQMQFSYTVSFFHCTNKRWTYSYILCLYLCVSLLTKGVSAPPTMVIPREELVLGISTCDTSPSRTGSRVMPVKYKKIHLFKCIQIQRCFWISTALFSLFQKSDLSAAMAAIHLVFKFCLQHPIFHSIQTCPTAQFFCLMYLQYMYMYPLAKYGAKPR